MNTAAPVKTTSTRPANGQRYIDLLDRERVPEKACPYYVRHVERFIAAFPGRRLSSLDEAEISEYLQGLARQLRLATWQFQQPVVLSRDEIRRLLGEMSGVTGLMAGLMYGTGMRLMECVRLRVKDVDFAYRQIVVRNGKGDKPCVLPPGCAARQRDVLYAHLPLDRIKGLPTPQQELFDPRSVCWNFCLSWRG